MTRTTLPTWAEMSLWDNGRCRCPRCGKFRRRQDIPNDQPITVSLSSVTMRVVPGCRECLGQGELGLTAAG
jgi:hypothetical protein